jgi:hypothetical protein
VRLDLHDQAVPAVPAGSTVFGNSTSPGICQIVSCQDRAQRCDRRALAGVVLVVVRDMAGAQTWACAGSGARFVEAGAALVVLVVRQVRC